jgi:hypothetical protein
VSTSIGCYTAVFCAYSVRSGGKSSIVAGGLGWDGVAGRFVAVRRLGVDVVELTSCAVALGELPCMGPVESRKWRRPNHPHPSSKSTCFQLLTCMA